MRFILLKGQSQYGSLRLHIDQLAGAFNRLGHEAIIVDLMQADAGQRLNAAIARRVHMVFAINGMGCDIKAEGRSLFDALDAVYVTLLVDHPAYHWGRITTPIRKMAVSCLDRSHTAFLRRHLADQPLAGLSFMPPGANLRTPLDPGAFDRWADDRPIPILFTGTYRGVPRRPWREAENNAVTRLFDEAADLILSQDMLAVDDAIDRILADRSMELAPAHRRWLSLNCLDLHRFVEAQRRHALLVALNRAGVPLTIYGIGWEPHLDRFPAFQWKGEGSFEQTLSLLRQTRLVLNSNNNFVDGGHERVFAAQAAGAAVVSDVSAWYQERFQDGRDMLFYRWTALERAPDAILSALEHPDRLAGIARAGWRATMDHHSWDTRARHVLDLFETVAVCVR